jgi:hypothetical protein
LIDANAWLGESGNILMISVWCQQSCVDALRQLLVTPGAEAAAAAAAAAAAVGYYSSTSRMADQGIDATLQSAPSIIKAALYRWVDN